MKNLFSYENTNNGWNELLENISISFVIGESVEFNKFNIPRVPCLFENKRRGNLCECTNPSTKILKTGIVNHSTYAVY